MKPQTFEEWVNETHGLNMSYLIVSNQVDKLRDCWQAAMENAARICDEIAEDWPGEGFENVSFAIREAAKE